jgi:multiple sugar transport system substrate-binding protein
MLSDRGSSRVSRRRLLRVAAIGAGASVTLPLLAACASPAAPTPAPAAPAAPTQPGPATQVPTAKPATDGPAVEVKVHFRQGDDATGQDTKFIPEFNASQSRIIVRQETLPPQPEYFPKVAALHATNTIGDVVWASMAGFRSLAYRGVIRSIDDLVRGDQYDLSDYLPIGLSDMTWDGKLTGMPWGAHAGSPLLVYNVDMAEQAGVRIPEDISTYDQLIEAAVKMTVVRNGQPQAFGFAPATGATNIFQSQRAFDGSPWDEEGKRSTMRTPESLAGFKQWARFFEMDLSPIPGGDTNLNQMFSAGRIAMMQTGYTVDFAVGPAIGDQFRWDVTLMPEGPTGKLPTNFTINGLTIAQRARQPEAAWQYVKYLMDVENQIDIVLSGAGRPAPRNSVLDDPRLQSLKGHSTMVPVFAISEGWLEPWNFRIEEARSVVDQLSTAVATKQTTVDDRIGEIDQRLQEVLDKPRAE